MDESQVWLAISSAGRHAFDDLSIYLSDIIKESQPIPPAKTKKYASKFGNFLITMVQRTLKDSATASSAASGGGVDQGVFLCLIDFSFFLKLI